MKGSRFDYICHVCRTIVHLVNRYSMSDEFRRFYALKPYGLCPACADSAMRTRIQEALRPLELCDSCRDQCADALFTRSREKEVNDLELALSALGVDLCPSCITHRRAVLVPPIIRTAELCDECVPALRSTLLAETRTPLTADEVFAKGCEIAKRCDWCRYFSYTDERPHRAAPRQRSPHVAQTPTTPSCRITECHDAPIVRVRPDRWWEHVPASKLADAPTWFSTLLQQEQATYIATHCTDCHVPFAKAYEPTMHAAELLHGLAVEPDAIHPMLHGRCVRCAVQRVNPLGQLDVWLVREDVASSGVRLLSSIVIQAPEAGEHLVSGATLSLRVIDDLVQAVAPSGPVGPVSSFHQKRLRVEIEHGIRWDALLENIHVDVSHMLRLCAALEAAGYATRGSTARFRARRSYINSCERDVRRSGYDHIPIGARGNYVLSVELRWWILERDDFACVYCGNRASLETPDVRLVVDHVLPWRGGGNNEPENLATACQTCNGGKAHRRLPEDAYHRIIASTLERTHLKMRTDPIGVKVVLPTPRALSPSDNPNPPPFFDILRRISRKEE